MVELLVVLALVGLLGALVLGGVRASLDTARRTACLQNLKELVRAAQLYAADHGGAFPIAYRLDVTARTTLTWEQVLWGARENPPIQQCPGYTGRANWGDGEEFTGYNYNASFVGGFEVMRNGEVLKAYPSARLAMIADPAACALFGDGEYAGGANKFMRSPRPGPLDMGTSAAEGGTQGLRHQGRTNVGFADGRAASLDRVYSPAGKATIDPTASYGFLSEDNRMYDLE